MPFIRFPKHHKAPPEGGEYILCRCPGRQMDIVIFAVERFVPDNPTDQPPLVLTIMSDQPKQRHGCGCLDMKAFKAILLTQNYKVWAGFTYQPLLRKIAKINQVSLHFS